jgi:hypothetical protein
MGWDFVGQFVLSLRAFLPIKANKVDELLRVRINTSILYLSLCFIDIHKYIR